MISDPDFDFDGLGPNYRLRRKDFPFWQLADPLDRKSSILSDSNNVVSSQGVHHAIFGQEGRPGPDPDGFWVGQANVRRVEPRNTPTMINTVFNRRNLWDLPAQNLFNGVSPFGTAMQTRSSTAPTTLRTPRRQPCPSICLVIPQS